MFEVPREGDVVPSVLPNSAEPRFTDCPELCSTVAVSVECLFCDGAFVLPVFCLRVPLNALMLPGFLLQGFRRHVKM